MQANLLKQVNAKRTSRNRNAMTLDREQDNWGDKRRGNLRGVEKWRDRRLPLSEGDLRLAKSAALTLQMGAPVTG